LASSVESIKKNTFEIYWCEFYMNASKLAWLSIKKLIIFEIKIYVIQLCDYSTTL